MGVASVVALVASAWVVAVPADATTMHVNCGATALQPKIAAAPAGSTLLLNGRRPVLR